MPIVAAKKTYNVIPGSEHPAVYDEPGVFIPFFEEDKAMLEQAEKNAADAVLTAEEESKKSVEAAQAEAETKIAEAKVLAQKLIDEAKADWENRKAIFEKYDYDTVNDALKTKYSDNGEVFKKELLNFNIPEGGYFSKPEQVLAPIKQVVYSKKYAHPILEYMKG